MSNGTLLSLVQDTLFTLSADTVDSISDTIESDQVAHIVLSEFYALVNSNDFPYTKRTFVLEGLGDTTHPTHMKLPFKVKHLDFIRYNHADITDVDLDFKLIAYKTPEDFIRHVSSRSSSDADYTVINDFGGVPLIVSKVDAPLYYTAFDDEYIVFDAYDSAVDSTLQGSKTICYGTFEPTLSLQDSALIDIPTQWFELLKQNVRQASSFYLRQQVDTIATNRGRKIHLDLQAQSARVQGEVRPNNGRRRR